MKLTANRKALLEALDLAVGVISSRTPKPILLCVLLEAADGKLSVYATDLEVSARRIIGSPSESTIDIARDGRCVVNAGKLRDILREYTDEVAMLELNEKSGNFVVTIGNNTDAFKIPVTDDPKNFPDERKLEDAKEFSIAAGVLHSLVDRTTFCVAQESTRYAFNGALMEFGNGKLQCVATDGRRLASATASVETPNKRAAAPIVPQKAINLLAKLGTGDSDPVTIKVTDTRIVFSAGAVTLGSNLVEGQFPPYNDVIPRDCDKKMEASTADLLGVVRRAALMTTEESKGVKLSLSKKGLVVSARSPEAGEATVSLPCKYEGADIEIGMNPRFIEQFLRVVDTETVTLELSVPNRPGLFKAGTDLEAVIMPANLQ